MLLRAAGVPARYVTGYMLEARAGEAVTVTEENAHAWAEYYEPHLGIWLPLEATPAQEIPVPTLRPQTAPAGSTAATEPEPETTTPATEPSQEPPLPPEPAVPETHAPIPSEPAPAGQNASFPLGLLLLALVPGIVAAQRSVRLTLKQRRQRNAGPNELALLYWKEAELLARLLKKAPPRELKELALKAKFSQHALTEEELARFGSFRRHCLTQLKKSPWYLRLIHRFVYAAY